MGAYKHGQKKGGKMSVLIKGMEKPKSCTWWDGRCPLLGDDDDCKLQDCQEEWTWQDQYKGCPLSDAPDKNVGDMIYRQAAIEAFEDTTFTKKRDSKKIIRVATRTARTAVDTSVGETTRKTGYVYSNR